MLPAHTDRTVLHCAERQKRTLGVGRQQRRPRFTTSCATRRNCPGRLRWHCAPSTLGRASTMSFAQLASGATMTSSRCCLTKGLHPTQQSRLYTMPTAASSAPCVRASSVRPPEAPDACACSSRARASTSIRCNSSCLDMRGTTRSCSRATSVRPRSYASYSKPAQAASTLSKMGLRVLRSRR